VVVVTLKHGVDMEETQHSKLIQVIPLPDMVVTMGCNVICPHIPWAEAEDWGLDDPTGQPDDVFIETIKIIEDKVLDLKRRMEENV